MNTSTRDKISVILQNQEAAGYHPFAKDILARLNEGAVLTDKQEQGIDRVWERIPASKSGGQCEQCAGSGWSDLWTDEKLSLIAERCECLGGPEGLARAMEKADPPDYKLAQSIRNTFSIEGRKFLKRFMPKQATQQECDAAMKVLNVMREIRGLAPVEHNKPPTPPAVLDEYSV